MDQTLYFEYLINLEAIRGSKHSSLDLDEMQFDAASCWRLTRANCVH